MRFMRTRPSGVDQDIPVFEFAMGKVELKLILGILTTSYINWPSGMQFQQDKARILNITHSIKNTLDDYDGRK